MVTLLLHGEPVLSESLFLGALIDAGVKPSTLDWEWQKLSLPEKYHNHVQRLTVGERSGIKFDLHIGGSCCSGHDHHDHAHHHAHASWQTVQEWIQTSTLADDLKHKVLTVLERWLDKLSATQGKTKDTVHLHQPEALEAVILMVGCEVALQTLSVEQTLALEAHSSSDLMRAWLDCRAQRLPQFPPYTLTTTGTAWGDAQGLSSLYAHIAELA